MLADKLHYCNIQERWVDNFYTMRDFVMSNVLFPKRILFAYRGNVRKLHEQGMGRFSEDEICSFRWGIWESVNAFPEESRRYASAEGCFWVLGGYEPTEADTTVCGFVVSVLVGSPAKKMYRPRLVRACFKCCPDQYCDMQAGYLPVRSMPGLGEV
jgi:hypothetical protein